MLSETPARESAKPAGSAGPVQCRICGSLDGSPLVLPELLYATGDEFDYWHCRGCGSMQIVTIPDDLSPYYPSDYYSYEPAKFGFRRTLRLAAAGIGNRLGLDLLRGGESLRPLLSFLPRSRGRVLDIGSGSAQLIRQLSLLSHDCTAVDPYMEVRGRRSGVNFLKCTMDEVEGDYDLVILFDSLEHMVDPHQAFAGISRLLRPSGVAIIHIPVTPNNVYDTYGTWWPGLDPPRHIYTFSLDALHLLAAKHGLVVKKVNYDAMPWSLVAARGYQAGVSAYASFDPDELKGTAADIAETDRANREGRADAIYLQLTHPQPA